MRTPLDDILYELLRGLGYLIKSLFVRAPGEPGFMQTMIGIIAIVAVIAILILASAWMWSFFP